MSAAGEASRRAESGKRSGATGREAALAVAGRSPRRSSLFWWLFDNHDELLEAKGMGGLGFPWKAMCPVFAELELTLAAGAPVTPERARQTWWRVRKEKARLRAVGSGGGSRTRPPARTRSATQHAVADVGPVRSPARRGSASASGRSAAAATRPQSPGDRPGRGDGPSRRSVDDRDVSGGAPGPEHLRAARRAGALGEAGAERGGATAHQGDDADAALRALEEGSNSGPEQSCGSRKETVECPSKRSTMTASRS